MANVPSMNNIHDKFVNVNCPPNDPNIMTRKPNITGAENAFGRLILKMAIGDIEQPEDNDDHNLWMKAAGVNIPEGVEIRFVQREIDKVTIMIPPKEMAEFAICAARQIDNSDGPKNYALPDYYKIMVEGAWTDSIEDFYSHRVADYSMGYCR